MEKGRVFSLILTAVIAISACFLISLDISNSDTTITHADGNQSPQEENATNQDGNQGKTNGDNTIRNHVQNNISGEEATVSNSINNKLSNSRNNQINNNVTNNIDVNVNVNVSNSVNNNANTEENTSNKTNNTGKNNKNNSQNSGHGNNNGRSDGNKERQKNDQSNSKEMVWGVDSASLTTERLLACVQENFGSPEIWGRYLGTKESVSKGLTPNEVELLHSNNINILAIWNHFTNATGYQKGQTEAQEAIQKAQELGIPKGVALFADVEPSYPIDSAFIRGWYETINQSSYNPGIYGIFEADTNLYQAFEEAAANHSAIKDHMFVWTSAPSAGITTEANAPAYQPTAPENSLVAGWQYGIKAQTCNIDTNLFNGNVLEVVW